MTTVTTAAEAYQRYTEYLHDKRLIQSKWHDITDDGRALACGLGVLGENVSSPQDCPATIMPKWLAQMVPWFFDNQDAKQAKSWGLEFYAELARLNGFVPFSVVYDWQATVVGPLAIEQAEARNGDVSAHRALAEMQFAALNGKTFSADEWRPILKAAFLDIHKFSYHFKADADSDANVYADANSYAYADAYAYANVNAYAYANPDANSYAKYREKISCFAAGMVECLKRVSA
jgi:hypothetical protein